MADSLLFDGVDDRIQWNQGDYAGSGNHSVGCVYKIASAASGDFSFMTGHHNTGGPGLQIDDGEFLLYWNGAAGTRSSGGTVNFDQWSMAVTTKVTGTNTPRFHSYTYGAAGMSHDDALASVANWTTPTSLRTSDQTEAMNGNLLLVAYWDRVISDSEALTLEDPSLQAWLDLAPDELFRLDAMTGILSETGSGFENGRTGTTLDTGDVPSGWLDAAAGPAPAVNPYYLDSHPRYLRSGRSTVK